MRPAIRENKTKVSATQKVSLLFDNRHVSLISWSKPIRDSEGRTPPLIGRGPDIPACMCVCVWRCVCCCCQTEREVSSRDARSSFSESALFRERLTVPPGFCDRWIYRKIKQTGRFSSFFSVLWRHRNAHSVKERLFLSSKNGMNSFAFSSCPIYKSYIGQTNRKRNESALLVWATDRLSARTGAAGCSRSRDTIIHSAGRYSE